MINQLFDLIGFVIIGIVIAIIFDFFRALRKVKKIPPFIVVIQDIIYFIIATLVIMYGIISILDTNMRLYIFIAIILGCLIYFNFFSKHVINLYIILFKMSKNILEFIILPFYLSIYLIVKICIIIKKIAKKCCKKFFYVITLIQKSLKKKKIKVKKRKKKVLKNEESI